MEEVRRLRRERGLSQAKLAALADLDPSTVSQIETGARQANARTLERIAGALGAEVADLFPKVQPPLPEIEEGAEDDGFDSPSRSYRLPAPQDLEQRREDGRREDVYASWLEFINRYADRWEEKIANRTLDRGAVAEFVASQEDMNPILLRLGRQEEQEHPDYPYTYGPVMNEVVGRLMDLFNPLIEAEVKQAEQSDLEQLRRRREEFAQDRRTAASG